MDRTRFHRLSNAPAESEAQPLFRRATMPKVDGFNFPEPDMLMTLEESGDCTPLDALPIDPDQSLQERFSAAAAERGIALQEATTRLVEWFVQQDDTLQ